MTDPEESADSNAAAESQPPDRPSRDEVPTSGTPTDSDVSATSAKGDSDELTGKYYFPIPGEKLGKYEIQSVLGHGGMGVVFQAWDPDLQRSVAIKILGPQLALSRTARRRFLREARAAASINHPNVLTVHAVEQHAEFPFLVMERVTGRTLKGHLAQHGPLDSIEAIRLSHQIALGLAAAHAQGVIHRDVKPGNVMLDQGGTRVRLTDFGLARAVMDNVDLTSEDHAVGTPAYMSPEQVRGDRLDARSDLFGFGCLIYFMFTRQSPFQGRVTAETWDRILKEQPPRLDEVRPGAPPLLAEITARLLEKDPNDRFQSAADVAAELERLLVLLNQASSDQIDALLRDTHVTVRPLASKRHSARPRQLLAGGVLLLLVTSVTASQYVPSLNLSFFRSGSATLGDTSQQSLLEPVQPKLHAIRVGSDDRSDCKSIAEAIQRAAQPCVITVAGPGPYYESVDIVGSAYDGLLLTAESSVIWSCPPDKSTHPLRLASVRNVTVSGFDFQIQAAGAHGVEIMGAAENVLLKQCTFEHTATLPRLSLLWICANTTDWDKRVRVVDCRFRAAGRTSACISISNGPAEGSHVEITNSRFTALTTHLYVANSCRQLRVANCMFDGGMNAINLSLLDRSRNYPIDIVNNTFSDVKFWLGLMDSFRGGQTSSGSGGGVVLNNLVLGGERAQGGEDQFEHLFAHWRVESNWWERSATTRPNADRDGQLATLVDDVSLVQRADPAAPGYLVPLPDSPLATSGAGGEWALYVGAHPPSPQL